MIDYTEDPVVVIIQTIKRWTRIVVLNLLDENPIIEPRQMSNQANEIVTLRFYFERLESEPSPRRKVAQQLRRSQERTHKRLVAGMTNLCASLYAARTI